MGHLIQLYYPEAPSGTWSIHEHGDETKPALAFSDIACVTPYTSRVLTAAGRAQFFVNQLVDVVVATAAGVEVETIEGAGVSAEVVQLRSPSFIGTDPVTNQQVTAGMIHLREAMDLLAESFGATDFNVRETGTAVDRPLKDALASVRATNNRVFDVTQSPYNAIGDGTTLNDTAIVAAVAASNAVGGGTVYLPTGVYLVSGTIQITQNTKFLGDGKTVSILRSVNATAGVAVSPLVTFTLDSMMVDMTAMTGSPVIAAAPLSTVEFLSAQTRGPAGGTNPNLLNGSVFADNSTFSNEATAAIGAGCGALSMSGGNEVVRIRDCYFAGNGGTACIFSAIPDLIVSGCNFPSTPINDKIVISVNGAVARSSVFGCTGTPSSTAQSLIRMVQDSPMSEANNMFYGNGVPGNIIRHDIAAPVQPIISLSKSQLVVTSTGAALAPIASVAENILDANANVTIDVPTLAAGGTFNPPNGYVIVFWLRNTTGGAITVTLNAVYKGTATNLAAGTTRFYAFRYKASGTPAGWVQMGSIFDFT